MICLNLTTNHYFEYKNKIELNKKLKKLIGDTTAKDFTNDGIWQTTDTIVKNVPTHLQPYIKGYGLNVYGRIF